MLALLVRLPLVLITSAVVPPVRFAWPPVVKFTLLSAALAVRLPELEMVVFPPTIPP